MDQITGQSHASTRRHGRSMTAVFALALVVSCCAGHPAKAAGQNATGVTAIEGTSVELEGELDVLYEDDDTGGRLRHFLIVRDRRIPLYFQDGAGRDLPSGTRVRVTGRMRKDGNLEEGGLTVTSITVTGSAAVDVRCANVGRAVAADVGVPGIVGHDQHDVGLSGDRWSPVAEDVVRSNAAANGAATDRRSMPLANLRFDDAASHLGNPSSSQRCPSPCISNRTPRGAFVTACFCTPRVSAPFTIAS